MKRITSVLLIAVMAVSLVGCGDDNPAASIDPALVLNCINRRIFFGFGWKDLCCLPFEGVGGLVVGFDEIGYGLAELSNRCETAAPEGLSPQDTEPDLYLVQPGSVCGGVIEVDVGMSG